jgi:uncharacterized membrane protein HdeD (DUF308 family)
MAEPQAEPQAKNTISLTLMGIASIILGILAIGTPAVAGKAVVLVIGVLLLVMGIVQVISALRSEGWSHKLPPLILGIITTLAGIGVLGHPLLGLTFLTLMLAVFFVIEGVWKIIASFSYRPASGWLAVLASGVITLILGGLIWAEWPVSGLWAVGILVGVDLVMTGISLVAVASTLRRLGKSMADSTAV